MPWFAAFRPAIDPARGGDTHDSVETLDCEFTGNALAYCEIWVVNLLCTLCTFGLFSPWARARSRRYLCANISIGRHRLSDDSIADEALPWAAAAAFGGTLALVALSAALLSPLAVLAVLALAYPGWRHWSLRRAARSLRYRRAHFGYDGDWAASWWRLLVFPLASLALCALPLGHALRASWQYRINHSRYADHRFVAQFSLASIWRALLSSAAALIGGLALALVAGFALALSAAGDAAVGVFFQWPLGGEIDPAQALTGVLSLLAVAYALGYWRGCEQQLLADAIRLPVGIDFVNELAPARLGATYALNLFAVLATAGLATPWAVVRTARLRWGALTVMAYTDVDQLTGDRGVMIEWPLAAAEALAPRRAAA